MYIWTCKKCGQSYDDMFCGDYICDDCFDKMKREEKKQKRRNSPFFRFLSFVLALSFMLCIFSGFGVAHAEEVTTEAIEEIKSSGTYLGYDVLKLQPEEKVDYYAFNQIFDNYRNADTNINCMDVYLMAFDESGKSHFYGYQNGCIGSLKYIYNEHYSYFGSGGGNQLYDSFVEENYLTCSFYYDATSLKRYFWEDGNTLPTIYTYNFTYTDGINGFSGYHSDDLYLVFCPYNSSEVKYNDIFSSLLLGTKTNDFVPSVTTPTYTAKFHSFASMNDGGETLNMLDWLGLGQQYPIADFSINDNGQLHSYSLRISSNKNYVDVCMGLWEDYKNNNITSAWGNGLGIFLSVKEIAKVVAGKAVLGTLGPIGALLITFPIETGTAQAIRTIAQYNLLNSIGDLSYVTEYNLTNSYLQFQEGESSSRAYSVCLADYVSIVKGLLYKLEIVDNNTGLILDTAYFCNDTTFAKTNTGYGTKVYNYSDYNDLLGDVDNGNGYINNDSYTQGDSLHNDNPNDIVDWDKYNQYDFTNIQNLTGTLNSATAGLGGFFMACYNIIPPVFVSILLGTFTLVIILRVLGR